MTVAALEQKALQLPPADAWEKEIARRIKEIESGTVKGIPAEEVFARVRKKLHAARRLSSARRK